MASKIQLRRDTTANWIATNPVLSQGEPGLETDTHKIKYGDGVTRWTSLEYAGGGGTGVTARNKIGWIDAYGPIPNTDTDYWFSSVIVDNANSSYFAGSNYDDGVPIVIKLDPDGAVVWQTDLSAAFDGYEGAATSLDFEPGTGHIVVVADIWNSGTYSNQDEGTFVYVLDRATGEVVDNVGTKIRADNYVSTLTQGGWLEANDIVVTTATGYTIVGTMYGDVRLYELNSDTNVFNTYSGVDVLTAPMSLFEEGAAPRAWDDWQLRTSAAISGDRWITDVNYWENVNTTAGGASTGSGATFNFQFRPQTGKVTEAWTGTVYTYTNGQNYQVGDVIYVDGQQCGSNATCTITITAADAVDGYIQDYTHNWVPDTTRVKLRIDSGGYDFSNTTTNAGITWQLIEYTNEQGFIYSEAGWARQVGDQDDDWLGALDHDSDGNLYIVGQSHMDTNDGTDWTSFLMKVDTTGNLLWSKNYDFNNYEGNDYTGVVVDSEGNVIFSSDRLLSKVDSDGVVIWQRGIGYGDMMSTWNTCVDVDSADNIYFVGESNSVYFQDDSFIVVKFDKDGNCLWQGVVGSIGEENTHWNNGYQIAAVTDDFIYIAGSTQLYNQNNENGLAIAVPTAGFTDDVGINDSYFFRNSTYTITTASDVMGDLRHHDVILAFNSATITVTTASTIATTTTYNVLTMAAYDNQGGELAGVRHLTFEDGTTQTTAAVVGNPVSLSGYVTGDDNHWFTISDANKTVVVDNDNGGYDSWLYVPATYDVPFPNGTVITIILKDAVGYSTWLNNDGNGDVRIYADGFEGHNSWQLNCEQWDGQYVYTLQLVERIIDGANNDWWILSGGTYAYNNQKTYDVD